MVKQAEPDVHVVRMRPLADFALRTPQVLRTRVTVGSVLSISLGSLPIVSASTTLCYQRRHPRLHLPPRTMLFTSRHPFACSILDMDISRGTITPSHTKPMLCRRSSTPSHPHIYLTTSDYPQPQLASRSRRWSSYHHHYIQDSLASTS